MELEDCLDTCHDHRSVRVKGTKVGLEQLVVRHRRGFEAWRIRQDFPKLSEEQIYAALAYYLHNRPQGDAIVAQTEDQQPIVIGDISASDKSQPVILPHAHATPAPCHSVSHPPTPLP